jgi:hypothetical protein
MSAERGQDGGVVGRGNPLGSWWTTGVLVVVALFLVRGGPAMPTALAEMTAVQGSYTMMTTDGGNDEILVVVDSREEMVLVYRIDQSGKLALQERERLSELFARARARAIGVP